MSTPRQFYIHADILRGIRQRTQEIHTALDAVVFDAAEDHPQAGPLTIADIERAADLFKQMDPPPVIRVHDAGELDALAEMLATKPRPHGGGELAFSGFTVKVSAAVPRGQAIVLQEHRDGRDPDLYVVKLTEE